MTDESNEDYLADKIYAACAEDYLASLSGIEREGVLVKWWLNLGEDDEVKALLALPGIRDTIGADVGMYYGRGVLGGGEPPIKL